MKIPHIFLAVITFSLASNIFAAEKTIPFSNLPQAIQTAVRGVIGSAPITRVVEEKEETLFYTVEYTGLNGRKFEIEVSPQGKVLENGELINAVDTPEPVHKTIAEKTKGVVWLKVIKASHDGKPAFIVKFDRGGDNEGKFTLNEKGEIVSD
jgi:hypothetical protein